MKKHIISGQRVLFFIILVFLPFGIHANAQTNRGATVPADTIPEALKKYPISDFFVPSTEKKAGVIHRLIGSVIVIHLAKEEAYFGQPGDAIYENDALYTLKDSRCRVKFLNDDVVNMAADTDFSVDKFLDQPEKGKKDSLFSLMKGKAIFYAMRLLRYRDIKFRVRTPTATMGVRGTKVGMYVFTDPTTNRSVTLVASWDGNVLVNAVLIVPGEMYDTQKNVVQRLEPQTMENFEIETSTFTTAAKSGGAAQFSTTGNVAITFGADQLDQLAKIISQQTGADSEDFFSELLTIVSGPVVPTHGYFSAMLVRDDDGLMLEDVFISKDPNTVGGEWQADSIVDNDFVKWDDPIFTQITTDNGTSHTTSITTTSVTLDENTTPARVSDFLYLSFGYWESTGTFTGSPIFSFPGKSWWIQGYQPQNMVLPGGQTYTYSGEAHGTMFDSEANVDLGGTFNTQVNFGTASVQNFELSVTGSGGRSASISGAGGTITNGAFDLTGGTWKIEGDGTGEQNADYKEASGKFFGPRGQEMGGVWGMKFDSSLGAAGIFAGQR